MKMHRRGATLVVIGLLLIPLTLLASLFLDLGKVYAFRSEAQLAADAAALAGGSGLIQPGEGTGVATARVHQYVNENEIAGGYAEVDSLLIDVAAGRVDLVLAYQTGPLMIAPSGIRMQVRAGAQVSEETVISEEGAASQVKKIYLR